MAESVASAVQTEPGASKAAAAFLRFERATDLPLALLALLIVPVLVLGEQATSLTVRQVAAFINWLVWLAFCTEYLGKLWLAPVRRTYIRAAWIDQLIIALSPPFLVPTAFQGARAVRAVRAVRLLRFLRAVAVAAIGLREAGEALRHRRFHLVLLSTLVLVTLGAIGIFAVESGPNPNIHSVGDALWWSIVTATTVGYGDVSPVTPEGRLIAVALMIVGIGFIGLLTATITSFFMQPEQQEQDRALEQRLARIEELLQQLLDERKRP